MLFTESAYAQPIDKQCLLEISVFSVIHWTGDLNFKTPQFQFESYQSELIYLDG